MTSVRMTQESTNVKSSGLSQTLKDKAEAAQKALAGQKPFLDKNQIKELVGTMAASIHTTLKGKAPLVLTIYPEGSHFSNALTRKLGDFGLILEENYIDLSLKDEEIRLLVEPRVNLEGRTILITDSILKDGQKMAATLAYCQAKGAREVYCATLVNMPKGRFSKLQALQPNFYGVETTPFNPVGFGSDLNGYFRNEPTLWAPLEVSPSSSKNTKAILASLQHNAKPQLLQEQIKPSTTALENAQHAEKTFSRLQLLVSKKQLKEKIKLTAEVIKEKFKDSYPVILSMQKGGSHFATYLTEHLSGLALEESYMHLSRYGNSQQGGEVKVVAAPAVDLKGRTVIIAEDLIEGGLTIKNARDLCMQKGAAAVFVVAMGDKPQKRLEGLKNIKADYYCFQFDDRFLVGAGLDEKENLRNMFGVWAHEKQIAKEQPNLLASTEFKCKF